MKKHFLSALILMILTTFCIEEVLPPLNNQPTVSINIDKPVITTEDSVFISCSANDADGDSIYFNWSASKGLLKSPTDFDTSVVKWFPDGLGDGIYYVRLVVSDSLSEPVIDSVRIQIHNNPEYPVKPVLLFPADGAKKIANNVMLKWQGVSVDDKNLLYDIYLGTGDQYQLIESDYSIDSLNVDGLEYTTEYKWFIKAKYDETYFTLSDTSSFTTRTFTTGTIPSDIEFVTVPAGDFKKSDLEGDSIKIATTEEYQIMKYEVTYKHYVGFLNEIYSTSEIYVLNDEVLGAYDGDNYLSADTNYTYFSVAADSVVSFANETFSIKAGFENYPVTNVTWFGAEAFARYYNLQLPTEIEWEKAARGENGINYSGTKDGEKDTLTFAMANMRDSLDTNSDGIKDTVVNMFNSATEVGYYNGANTITSYGLSIPTLNYTSPYGAYDMTANVMEWVSDVLPGSTPESAQRRAAGGSFKVRAEVCKTWSFFNFSALNTTNEVGFRCVKK